MELKVYVVEQGEVIREVAKTQNLITLLQPLTQDHVSKNPLEMRRSAVLGDVMKILKKTIEK